MKSRPRLPAVFASLALMLAACGGDSDGGQSSPTAQMGDDEATPTTDADGAAAIDGPLVFISGLGLYAVAADSGDGRALEFRDVEGAALRPNPVVADGRAYVFTFDTIEGQENAHNGYLSRLDLATGDDTRFVEVGFDRETDTAEELFQYEEIVVAAGDLWVVKQQFGEGGSELLLRFDGVTGELLERIAAPGIAGIVTDGERLYAFTAAGLEALDPSTGRFETLLAAGTDLEELLAPGIDLKPAFASEDRSAPPARVVALAAIDSSAVGRGQREVATLAYGEGGLWFGWHQNFSTTGGERFLAEALMRFDIVSGRIDRVVATVELGTRFLDDSTISNGHGDIVWHAGALWVVDPQSNGAVLRIEAASGSVAVAYEPCGEEFICEDRDDVLFNRTDPERLWIELTRFEDQGDGSRVGMIFLERLDSTTGALVLQVPFAQIFR